MVKRLGRGLLSQLFKFSIVFLVLTTALVVVFGTPDRLKSSLKDSGLFDSAVDTVLDESQKDQSNKNDEVPLDDPGVRQAVKTAFPADFLEQTSGQFIDGIYGWLQGTTETPQYELNLSDSKKRLASAVGDAAVKRVKSLPNCTAAQLLKIDQDNLDLFRLKCRPPGIDLKAERTKIVRQIASNDDFLKDTHITAADLPKDNGQTVFDKIDAVPNIFSWIQRLPWIMGILAILGASGLILLHDEKRRGIWLVGRNLLVLGILLTIGALIANYLSGHIQFIKVEDGNTLQQTMVSVVRSLIMAVNKVIIIFGAIYAAVGGIIMLFIHHMRPKISSVKKS
jgi:hypothetical protein